MNSSKGGINLTPIITIIIPVYNAQVYLNRLVKSLNEQTYQNFEVILVNDGSTDESPKMLDEYAKQYEHFTVIHQENSGAPVARNKGIQAAKGEYLYFCDADDELELTTLERFYDKAINTGADLILGYYKKIDLARHCLKNITFDPNILTDKKACMFLSPFPGNKLIKKSTIDQNQLFFERVKIGQDLLFYQMLLPHVEKIACVDENIYNYYVNEGSISHSYDARIVGIIETFNIMEAYYRKIQMYDMYQDELQYLKNNHILTQIFKVPFIKDSQMRKQVFTDLTAHLSLDGLNQNKRYNKLSMCVFLLVPRLKFFFTNSTIRPFVMKFFAWYNSRGYQKSTKA